MAALGAGAIATASGQAAPGNSRPHGRRQGHIVASTACHGSSHNLLHHTAPLWCRHQLCTARRSGRMARCRAANTRLFFGETVGTPVWTCWIPRPWRKSRMKPGVPLLVDSTLTPLAAQPLTQGADMVYHSAAIF